MAASHDAEEYDEDLAGWLMAALQDSRIDGVLIGGHAVNFWTDPRFTHDIDLTVEANRRGFEAMVSRLVEAGFVVIRHQDLGDESGPDFARLERSEKNQVIDLIPAKDPYQVLVMQRARRETDRILPVATAEDLIVLKLIAHRSKDVSDAVHMARSQDIDWDYVAHWADVWGETERLIGLRRMLTGDPFGADLAQEP